MATRFVAQTIRFGASITWCAKRNIGLDYAGIAPSFALHGTAGLALGSRRQMQNLSLRVRCWVTRWHGCWGGLESRKTDTKRPKRGLACRPRATVPADRNGLTVSVCGGRSSRSQLIRLIKNSCKNKNGLTERSARRLVQLAVERARRNEANLATGIDG